MAAMGTVYSGGGWGRGGGACGAGDGVVEARRGLAFRHKMIYSSLS